MERVTSYMPTIARIGTIVVRLKGATMDVISSGWCSERCRVACASCVESSGSAECEGCSRTSLSSLCCDCDNVSRYRSCRTNYVSKRYVNVCAAVCLLLLISGLSPQTSAAPHRPSSKKMDRSRRSSQEENPLWSNPCDYKNVNDIPVLEYNPTRARNIATLAKNVRDKAATYRNEFADKIHSYKNFEILLGEWESTDWLRNFSWHREEALPEKKKFSQTMPDEYVDTLMENIDDVLPHLYKSLKMVVASLDSMYREGLNDQPSPTLKENIRKTMHDVRGVLCQFNEVMTSRNLEIKTIDSSEIPTFDGMEKQVLLLLVYRDTLNILEYIAQVFQKMAEHNAENGQ